jgi:predicted ABC-type ATPase
MNDLPRLRMFAGPNGSGKSTIKSVIRPELLGVYINPDEIEKDIRNGDFLDLQAFGVRTTSLGSSFRHVARDWTILVVYS